MATLLQILAASLPPSARQLLKRLPIAFTQNQKYDAQAAAIIKRVCASRSNCVDVGAHKGDYLKLFLKASPGGVHYGFEPVQGLFKALEKQFRGNGQVRLYEYALSDVTGRSAFNYVRSNPAYSGLKKRVYDRKGEVDETVWVQTVRLDEIIAPDTPVQLIKIDVEGGEMGVLRGGRKVLERDRPVVIFEAGIGGSDIYGTTPEDLFHFFEALGYGIYLMKDFLAGRPELTRARFRQEFYGRINYYFVATPSLHPDKK